MEQVVFLHSVFILLFLCFISQKLIHFVVFSSVASVFNECYILVCEASVNVSQEIPALGGCNVLRVQSVNV